MSAVSVTPSRRLRAALIGFGGVIAGAAIGIALAFGAVWAVRAFGSDPSSWTDIGVAAVALVLVTPALTIVGALIGVRLATGRALARPVPLTALIVVIVAGVGAMIGEGITRLSLGLVGVALGVAAAGALDPGPR